MRFVSIGWKFLVFIGAVPQFLKVESHTGFPWAIPLCCVMLQWYLALPLVTAGPLVFGVYL